MPKKKALNMRAIFACMVCYYHDIACAAFSPELGIYAYGNVLSMAWILLRASVSGKKIRKFISADFAGDLRVVLRGDAGKAEG